MSNRLQHGRVVVRRPTTPELLRLVVSNEKPGRAPDQPASLNCAWSLDADGRLVCAWRLAQNCNRERRG